MRYLFILFALVISQCKSLPLPVGQIVKYRVSSKYFNRLNYTSVAAENSNSLYNLLSQIHYGKEASTTETAVTANVNANVENNYDNYSDVSKLTASDDSPEVIFAHSFMAFSWLITINIITANNVCI